MIHNTLNDGELVRGRDIRELINEINSNELHGDNTTVTVNKARGGTYISVIDQYGGGGDSSAQTLTPFTMSLSKNDEDEQLVNISSGCVFINDTEYFIETNSVNIDSESAGDLFIYLKLSANWKDDDDFLGYPVLTVKEGTEIANTNFAYNSVKFPATDEGHYFYTIGKVVITEKDSVKSYAIEQVAVDNSLFTSNTQNSFTLNRIFQAKANDSADDATYNTYCNKGQAILPEISVNTPTVKTAIAVDESKYYYLKITATQNEYLYLRNWNAEVITSDDLLVNSAEIYYVQIGRAGLAQVQSFEGIFSSTGVVW